MENVDKKVITDHKVFVDLYDREKSYILKNIKDSKTYKDLINGLMEAIGILEETRRELESQMENVNKEKVMRNTLLRSESRQIQLKERECLDYSKTIASHMRHI